MEDGWWSFVLCELHSYSGLGGMNSRKLGLSMLFCHSPMTETVNKINLISKWFVMIVCSWSVWGTVFRSELVMAWSSSLEGMPCNSDLNVYLNIEVVIRLLQWSPLLRTQVVLQILWVVVVSGISVVFSHSVGFVWWSRLSCLMLVFVIVYDLYYCNI